MIEAEQVAHAQAMLWSAHEVSPLTPTPPTRALPAA
jgi:hypothetical protein